MKQLKFHNLEFTYKEKNEIVEYGEQRDWILADVIVSAIEKGLKVSFSYDSYHDVAQLSITAKPKEHPFNGFVVVTKHSSVETLGAILMWLVAEGFDQIEAPGSGKEAYDW